MDNHITEMDRIVHYDTIGQYEVSSELFLDLIFNSACNCACPFCIARTPCYAQDDFSMWCDSLKYALQTYPIKSIIILGGEATIDPQFFNRLHHLEKFIEESKAQIDNIILTTNGIKLANERFLIPLTRFNITSVNLSYMHYSEPLNRNIMRGQCLTHKQLQYISEVLYQNNITMRLNANVWKGNLDSVDELEQYTYTLSNIADAIKFSPLMNSSMFGTVPSVTQYTSEHELPAEQIRQLYDEFSARHTIVKENRVFGLVDYKALNINGQRVILKYAQVEDKYDFSSYIPTLKLYCNGNLSNEWDFTKTLQPLKKDAP